MRAKRSGPLPSPRRNHRRAPGRHPRVGERVSTTSLYKIGTSEADDGTVVPAEGIRTPIRDDAAGNGFITYGGLHVVGIGSPKACRPHPDRIALLGKSAC